MTILNESGVPEASSPLRGLFGLAEKLPDALFVVAGTGADAHLALSLSGPLPGSPTPPRGDDSSGVRSRVAFVVVEADEEPEGGSLASRVVEAAAGAGEGLGVVLLVACRSARLLGIDAGFEAELATRRLGLPVVTVEAEAGPGPLSTDLEDATLGALVGLCPRGVPGSEEEPVRTKGQPKGGAKGGFIRMLQKRSGRGGAGDRAARTVVLLGARGGDSRGELADELRRAGVEVAGGVPAAASGWSFGGIGALPIVGEGTVLAVTDPYLARAAGAAEKHGAMVVRTLLPIGVDGTSRFVGDVATAAGRVVLGEANRARQVWESLEHLRARVRGKRVFFTGDSGLEVPLARFLANAGAVVLEVGAPRLERRFLAAELSALGSDVDVVESPDWRAQLERIDAARPDVVVTSPGLYVPLVARGHLCRTSQDIIGLDPHGYEGARRVLALFARTFERAEALDALNL